MPNPRWYLHGGVCATAVTSLVGLVHPNIHIVCRKKVPGTGLFCLWTVASMGSRCWPEASYQSWRAANCSCAKNSMAGPERKATSMNLGLHCLYMREAGSSSLLLDVRGVMARTNPNNIWRSPSSSAGSSVVPTMATSLPVPMGLTLWWCASLARRLKTSVLPRLGCRNANASCPPLTFQFFFRPTPYGFRQVVQHVSKHVAY